MEKVTINFQLIGDEALALRKFSVNHFRKPVDQVRWLLQKELERQGYLKQQITQEKETHHASNN